ncbi:hypothetical protein [Sphingobacterium kitahiroshimense]|uniref:hypothetical protein n=1 Tax=Sphingobacterium kitahiroshimense TaxID=470446 RepID=UPI0032090154
MSIYAAKALYRPQPSEATFAATDDQHNRIIPLTQTKQTAIFGLEKFFEKTVLGVPRNRRNSGKVAEASTITGLGSMMRKSAGGMWWIHWRNNTDAGLRTIIR